MLSAQCGECFMSYNVKPSLAGKRVRCKQCGATILVPHPQANSTKSAPGADPAEESMPLPSRVGKRRKKPATRRKSFKTPLWIAGGAAIVIGLVVVIVGPASSLIDTTVSTIRGAIVDDSREAKIERFIIKLAGNEYYRVDLKHASASNGNSVTEFGQGKSLKGLVQENYQRVPLTGNITATQGMRTELNATVLTSEIQAEFGEPDKIKTHETSADHNSETWTYGDILITVEHGKVKEFARWEKEKRRFVIHNGRVQQM
jgi:hypothetical protein